MIPQTAIEQLLFSTVRLEAFTPEGTTAGTAFVFSYDKGAKTYPFLVTNKHVIKEASAGKFFFTESDGTNPKLGQRVDVNVPEFKDAWCGHPDPRIDVTVMPLAPVIEHIRQRGKQVFIRSISSTLIPTTQQNEDLDALEEVVFIGYPSGLYDEKHLLPIIRRGTTATHPQIDYQSKKKFLVDASVFPGSSGSPVLICNTGMYTRKQGATVIGSRVFFLGVIASVLIREDEGRIEIVETPTHEIAIKSTQMIDLGVVYKAVTVVETVEELLRKRGEI